MKILQTAFEALLVVILFVLLLSPFYVITLFNAVPINASVVAQVNNNK